MLTVTETVQRELTINEKMDLDNHYIIENYLKAMDAKDKEMAKEFGKILLMKAMFLKK